MGARSITRPEWLAMRGLGGSEAAAVCGLDPQRCSTLELWTRKRGLIEAPDLSDVEEVQMGSRLESIICEIASERFALELVDACETTDETFGAKVEGYVEGRQSFVRSVERPYQTATYDQVVRDPRTGEFGFVEGKNTSEYKREEWAHGRNPDRALCQVYHCFAVSPNLKFAVLAAMIGGNRVRPTMIRREDVEREIKAICKLEDEFWRRVEENDPPDADYSESSSRALAALHPDDNGLSITLGSEFVPLITERNALKDQVSEAEKRLRAIDNALKQAIGSNTFGVLPDGSGHVSLRTQERAAHQVSASKFRVLRVSDSARVPA